MPRNLVQVVPGITQNAHNACSVSLSLRIRLRNNDVFTIGQYVAHYRRDLRPRRGGDIFIAFGNFNGQPQSVWLGQVFHDFCCSPLPLNLALAHASCCRHGWGFKGAVAPLARAVGTNRQICLQPPSCLFYPAM